MIFFSQIPHVPGDKKKLRIDSVGPKKCGGGGYDTYCGGENSVVYSVYEFRLASNHGGQILATRGQLQLSIKL